ncbi:hypothetical protein H072_5456 [Dactylellina haptotyla CBS 200.50]|uniref:Uncharacterized protein n=1 Tax=Dactylellina haptotyla (strain CBS 200.50) TaxID=1284197 RepID=S8BZ37_DACHA|nr:hypothetical protein H072_5456 [Dactylellina haptotyla CBS 200.50]
MADSTDPRTRFAYNYTRESQRVERRPLASHDNIAPGTPSNQYESSSRQLNERQENAADYASNINNIENLSLDSRYMGQEHLDAADFHRYNSNNANAKVPAAKANEKCKVCLTTNCVMNGGSIEAERLRAVLARMKTARSKAMATKIGMEYMDSYLDAFDNQWKLEVSMLRASFENHFTLKDGEIFPKNAPAYGFSPLTPFASLGKLELVSILIHEGASVGATVSERGSQPLAHAAAWLGNEDTVEVLLAAGADPNASNSHGLTALHFAAGTGNLKVVKQLVNVGADIDAEAMGFNGIHSLPIFHQLRKNQVEVYGSIIDFLIESGAKTDLHNMTGWTPLQYVCMAGSAEVARRLIKLGVPKEPLEALRKKAAYEWAFTGYYKDWAMRLEEKI